MPHLRGAEWITIPAFSWLMALAWRRRDLDRARRVNITALGAGGLALTVFVSVALPRLVPPLAASVTRDWIPLILLLAFYQQAGQFITHADTEFEARLERLDHSLVFPALEWCGRHAAGAWILTSLELAYMSYYVALPLAPATLYLLGQGRDIGRLWTTVMLASYGSLGLVPFVQMRPPRLLGEKTSVALPAGKVRAFNLWILRRGSIHANTFPSAHVAIATACALAMLELCPLWVGLGFMAIAIGIALGAVAGRYHYGVDAIVGVAFAFAAFLAGTLLATA
jgi:membrane-associated phospholipid phosphatase